jgi:imidazolonepropionase
MKILYKDISKLYTSVGGYKRGSDMNDIKVYENCVVVVENGKFVFIGETYDGDVTSTVSLNGKVVLPGFIDAHTHLVHGGSREDEFEKKLNGVDYMEILKQGGGILNTVNKTNAASFNELYRQAYQSLNTMLSYGVTTVEAKSGYGLNLETELKQLEVSKALDEMHEVDLVHTFMGAHSVPVDYKGRSMEYIDEVVSWLSEVKKQGIAEYCDIFCEEGVFTIEESRKLLNKAIGLGFKVRIHADEIVTTHGAKLAVELGASSADHLMAVHADDVELLGESETVANVLPLTSFNLGKPFADIRNMVNNNCIVSLSTDYNPGSSPCENLQLAMQMSSIRCKLSPNEVLNAVTINAAKAIDRDHEIGSIEIGKKADFVVCDIPNLSYMMYHFGINHTHSVYKNGKLVYLKGDYHV